MGQFIFRNLIAAEVLNELEFIDGKIYANRYGKDEILIIDPNAGMVTGRINCLGLYRSQAEPNREMNGIAYHRESGNLLVTGKQWSKLFEIKIDER